MNLLQLAQRLHREAGGSNIGPTSIVNASKQHRRLFDWIADANREIESRPLDLRWMRRRVTVSTMVSPVAVSSYPPKQPLASGGLDIADFGRWRPASDEWCVKVEDPAQPGATWNLQYVPLDEWRECYVHSTQAPGRPSCWSVDDDNSLLIGPTPDAVYNIRTEYLRAARELALDGDIPEFEPEFHMILCWRALIEVGKFDNAADIMARGQTNYARLEHSLLDRYARKFTWGPALA